MLCRELDRPAGPLPPLPVAKPGGARPRGQPAHLPPSSPIAKVCAYDFDHAGHDGEAGLGLIDNLIGNLFLFHVLMMTWPCNSVPR